ncbi:hypothetical protein GCM10012289_21980 [Nonomuraea cavernae]|uniref:Uncharacterized protein n=1 Tax=Nonomuraea cavernae TaxID=2045107 RepID=A0A917YX66_9ACTN|nr:hypothetical protein GCM10012289_21980 [Nonomuraea cavernae]
MATRAAAARSRAFQARNKALDTFAGEAVFAGDTVVAGVDVPARAAAFAAAGKDVIRSAATAVVAVAPGTHRRDMPGTIVTSACTRIAARLCGRAPAPDHARTGPRPHRIAPAPDRARTGPVTFP